MNILSIYIGIGLLIAISIMIGYYQEIEPDVLELAANGCGVKGAIILLMIWICMIWPWFAIAAIQDLFNGY